MLVAAALMLCAVGTVTVTDGDTIRCGSLRVRLAAIDAPEIHGCRLGRVCVSGDGWASKANLERLIGRRGVTLRPIEYDRYGRLVACVSVGGVDLSNAQFSAGFAIERYRKLAQCARK